MSHTLFGNDFWLISRSASLPHQIYNLLGFWNLDNNYLGSSIVQLMFLSFSIYFIGSKLIGLHDKSHLIHCEHFLFINGDHSNGALLQLLTGSYFSEKIPKVWFSSLLLSSDY